MKQKTLLSLSFLTLISAAHAQDGKSSKPITGYAITAQQKGGHSWREVRLVDMGTGAELKTIYNSKAETEALNARTGKPVVKKDLVPAEPSLTTLKTYGDKVYTTTITKTFTNAKTVSDNIVTVNSGDKKVVNLDDALGGPNTKTITRVIVIKQPIATGQPFSTNSAAMAYDKKHERLYYTPMNIAQLRYIDLKSGKIYYFEDEAFGLVKGQGDVANQITRMSFGSDGNGYALTNDGNHLIRFTTGKKPVIEDLGALTDDPANGKQLIHAGSGYGGDMIADADKNLYLITANRNVFKINIGTRVATHLGAIKGLPQTFGTNGAMVEEGSKVIIASSESTTGYYRFDLNTLEAEKVSTSPDVFNASDLANGNLAFDKKKKQKEEPKEEAKESTASTSALPDTDKPAIKSGIAVYPNPVTNGVVRLSFADQPAGRYQVQLLDLSGRLITSKEVNIGSEAQVEEFRFPELSVKGSYLVRVTSDVNKVNVTNKIVVQ